MDSSHTSKTETTTTQVTSSDTAARSAAITSLALVGFVALVFIGIALAIYGARYVPTAVSQIASSTASHLSDSSGPATLSVVPATTTIAFQPSMQTTAVAMTATPANDTSSYVATPVKSPTVSAHVHEMYGLPDLSTHIIATGYLADGTNASFVAANVIPAGARAAVQFTVTNTGTNATGVWGFIAQLPTSNNYVFTSPTEQNLNPGDHILFTLGFDTHVAPGAQVVTVVADPSDAIPESNEGNNSASAAFSVGQQVQPVVTPAYGNTEYDNSGD